MESDLSNFHMKIILLKGTFKSTFLELYHMLEIIEVFQCMNRSIKVTRNWLFLNEGGLTASLYYVCYVVSELMSLSIKRHPKPSPTLFIFVTRSASSLMALTCSSKNSPSRKSVKCASLCSPM